MTAYYYTYLSTPSFFQAEPHYLSRIEKFMKKFFEFLKMRATLIFPSKMGVDKKLKIKLSLAWR